MKNDNHKIQHLLPEYVAGELGSQDQARVKRHLQDCPECRDFARDHQRLISGLQACRDWELTHHVSEDLLGRYSDGPDQLDASVRDVVETHLLFCESCSRELTLLTELNTSLAPEPAAKQTEHSLLKRTLAGFSHVLARPAFAYALAAAAIVLLAYPASRHFIDSRRPEPRPIPDMTTERVFHLTEKTRTATDFTEVRRRSGDEVVRLTFSFWPGTNRECKVLIEDENGKRLLQKTLSDQEAHWGDVQVAINSKVLKDGRYVLIAQEVSRSDPTDTLHTFYPFRVQTAGGPDLGGY